MPPPCSPTSKPDDPYRHFVTDGDGAYVGKHAILELWGIEDHHDKDAIKATFERACEDIGATVIFAHVHCFGPQCGTTGVVILAESHLSWHHYPETKYLAVDIFVCGQLHPADGFETIKDFWQPALIESQILHRGRIASRTIHETDYLKTNGNE